MSRTLDLDIRKMDLVQLRQEVMRLRTAFRKELSCTGNRCCWINLLEALPEGRRIRPLTLAKKSFLKNCEHYFDRNH